MTGMTDISRHGGDKKHRDELGIKVKDDALVDPELLGVTSSYLAQPEPLVDDSDDDDGYETGNTGPGMAAKVVQTSFKLLVFPLIFLYKAVISIKHVPWLCGRIWHGIKNAPASIQHTGTFFRGLFSGRIGKVLVVIGTLTGVIWISRKIAALGALISANRKAKRLAAEEAALEEQIRAEGSANQATQSATLNVQAGGHAHRKTTATVQFTQAQPQQQQQSNANATAKQQKPSQTESQTNSTEHDEPKSRRKIGFGQLSKLANAFKRSEPVTSPDAASSNGDSYDPFETPTNRWSTKKSVLFAAACLMLLVGGISVAKQVMQKSDGKDVATRDTGEESQGETLKQIVEPPKTTPTSSGIDPYAPGPHKISTKDFFSAQQQNQAAPVGNASTSGFTVPDAPQVSSGVPGFIPDNRSDSNNIAFAEQEPFSPPAVHSDAGFPPPPGVATDTIYSGQGSTTLQVGFLDDPEESAADDVWPDNNNSFAATIPQTHIDTGETGYGNTYATGNITPFSSMTNYDDPVDLPAPPSPLSNISMSGTPLSGTSLPDAPLQGSPLSETPRNFSLASSNLATGNRLSSGDDLPVAPAQTMAATNSGSLFALGGMSSNTPDTASTYQAEESIPSTLAATPRVLPGRSITSSQSEPEESIVTPQPAAQPSMFNLSSNDREQTYENAAPLAEVMRNTPQTPVTNNNGSSSGMGLAAIGSTPPTSSGMVNDQTEQDVWTTAPADQVASVDRNAIQPLTPSQPNNNFSLSQSNDPPMQTPFQNRAIEPVVAPVEPVIANVAIPTNNSMLPNDSVLPNNPPASNSLFDLSSSSPSQAPTQASIQTQPAPTTLPSVPTTLAQPTVQPTIQPFVAEPVTNQPSLVANTPASAPITPVLPPSATQESAVGIVSPSQHAATLPVVSPDSQANSAMSFPPPAVTNATPIQQYSAQPQVSQGVMQNTLPLNASQQNTLQSPQFPSATAPTQPVSYGQNNVYIVQQGDNIYKIAKQELGSVRRYREIYDLNRDRLPIGQDTLTAGMELLLPTM